MTEHDPGAARFDPTAFSALFDRSPVPLLLYDQTTLSVRAANDAALASYGRPRAELLNQSLSTLLGVRTLAGEATGERGRGRYTRGDGKVLCFEYHCLPLLYEGRQAGVTFLTCAALQSELEAAETTELSSARLELELEGRRLNEANRLKSEFLANMSHELRSPLNAVIGFAELMFKGKVGPLSERHREYLGDILSSSRHLLQLLNGVLDVARVDARQLELRPESVNLPKLVSEIRDILAGLASTKSIRVETEVAPEVANVTLDPAQLRQILYNYLSNALKFTAPGGAVAVRARVEGPDHLRLEVADNGVGVRPQDLARLFVEFQRLGSGDEYPGAGLGLALTRRLVEAQRGSVGVESVFGHGSTFWAVLPRHIKVNNE
jgi:signal transduction histidine kinase